ncbi:hypothetical protein, partial [Saccharicrinis sp. 156]|uniref:hypothetical protein n=1 Tax=Saccharicrinis sp. 156 TaxID=3417574 RepID=UPI003D325C5B
DCAQSADQMNITVTNQVVADAGSNAAVCENSSYTVSDANVDYGNGTYSWSHDGNGSLADVATLTPTYTPDASDAGNTVTLTLTADGNSGCSPAVDQMNITVANQVVADAGSNAAVCENSSYTVSDANVDYGNGTYSWSHDGNGSLADVATLTPTYTPDASDAGNTVTLTLTADGNSGCSPAVDQMNITVANQVVADAGSNAAVCENSSYTVSDANVDYG